MFFDRPASLRDSSSSLSASSVSSVRSRAWTLNSSSVPSSIGLGRPADPSQRAIGEVMRVDDQRSAFGHVGEIGLEGGGVHRDEDVGTIARGQDVVIGEMELEGLDTGQRAGWRADLGLEVGNVARSLPNIAVS